MLQELHYRIALTLIPQVGDVVAKELLSHFGTATDIFQARRHQLERIPGVGTFRASAIRGFKDFAEVDQEIGFMNRHDIRPVFYTDDAYPERLRQCYDSPVLLYCKGSADLCAPRMLGIVGTRKPTAYGLAVCTELVASLAPHNVTIISGMAYGIDIAAHRAAVAHGLPTIGVLAHGLDRLYPATHAATARQMEHNGGLLTDFRSGTEPNRQNFPRRNRIVAGLCDATLVIESGQRGGSLITADIACSYHRDVLAVPGRTNDPASAGCLELIKQHKAALITSAEDIMQALNWRPAAPVKPLAPQTHLFYDLNEEQQLIVKLLQGNTPLHIDEIQARSGIPQNRIPGLLLELEMQALLRSMPGNTYQLINT
ncbi:DNA-processing protein DprA [Chitinophaga sp. XS-30]|uniref:DNA-processing protein DprA n=1 Tax=Chitinophaga sp. XS-30 TaxID=2604421 RepID=UPI0011DE015E|nr:DNA-processing protein DprA [Chitinophaga sp. XS-30]QEH43709.1 DNA-protecting protein DprA [Chitinophaga sp. XS-30]